MLKSSIPDGGRSLCTALELEFREASSTPSDTCVSWDCVIIVCWDYVPGGVSHRKAAGDVAMLERRVFSPRMNFAMLNFYFELHTVLWAFDKEIFLMLVCLDQMRSVRYLCFHLKMQHLD